MTEGSGHARAFCTSIVRDSNMIALACGNSILKERTVFAILTISLLKLSAKLLSTFSATLETGTSNL